MDFKFISRSAALIATGFLIPFANPKYKKSLLFIKIIANKSSKTHQFSSKISEKKNQNATKKVYKTNM